MAKNYVCNGLLIKENKGIHSVHHYQIKDFQSMNFTTLLFIDCRNPSPTT